jgi:hypothetical protein
MVPVTPVGTGLDPGVVISVDPSGIPVGPIPSGEVAPSEGTAASGSVSVSSTWASAGLAQSKGQAVAAIKKSLIKVSPIAVERLRSETIGRSHELRTDRIPDRLPQDLVDLRHGGAVDPPAGDVGDRLELIGASRAP